MTITIQDVMYIARLARLELTEEEKQMFTGQLDAIFAYTQNLNKYNTDDIVPTSHAMPVQNVFREDTEQEFDNREQILLNGPEVEENAFVVPKII